MKEFVHFLFKISHPAGGWFRKENLSKSKKKTLKKNPFVLSPESHHLRGVAKKKESIRPNPAP